MTKKNASRVMIAILITIAVSVVYFNKSDTDNDELLAVCLNAQAGSTCWVETIEKIISRQGTAEAMRQIGDLATSHPEFIPICHDVTHKVGESAYEQFARRGSIDVTDETAYCSFGFYHGFMETLLGRGEGYEKAREFCDYVIGEIGDRVPNVSSACFHGVGHGATDVHNPQYYADPEELVSRSLPFCEDFARNDEELKLCVTGIFDSLSTAIYNHDNGMVMRDDDPLWLCKLQDKRYKEACYLDSMPSLLWYADHDLETAARLVDTYAEDVYKAIAMNAISDNAVRFMQLAGSDPIEHIDVCRVYDDELRLACISGLGEGVMQFGTPGVEYEEALIFCTSSVLSKDEKDDCMDRVLYYVRSRYSGEKAAQICSSVDERYRKHCQGERL